jgi:hypothetical protein
LSSILKALKKLENEAPVKSDIGSSLHQFYTKKSIHKRVNGDLPSNKHLLIIFTTLILMAGGGLILTFKPWKKEPSPTAKIDLNSELTPIIPTETKATTPTIKQETTRFQKDSEKFDPPNKAVKEPSLSAHKFKKEEPELFVKTETDPTEMAGVFEKKSFSQKPIKKNTLTGGNEEASEQKIDMGPFTSIPIRSANESMLKLQAIAWSSNPEKRMAVINDQIVHEGGMVERATVKHIGKNEVVIMKGSEKWRQLFGK